MSRSLHRDREQPALHKPPTTNSNSNPNNNTNNNNSEADKFQIFERWLRVNGAQFPLLELRKYDSPQKKNSRGDLDDDNLRDSGDLSTDNEAEEKKDNTVADRMQEGGSMDNMDMEGGVGMMSLNSRGATSSSSPAHEEKKDDDGSKEMRGVHARTAIPPQTTVVSIPKSCLITVEMGQSTPIGRKILGSDLELDAPKHIFLMIYLLWDRKVHGSKSFFAPYYDILPESLRNMPIFWTQDELEGLRGSHLLVQIQDRAEAIREDYESIRGIAPEFAQVATLEEFQWARMIVCSRNFGLLINGHRTSALVPHADMLNHYRPRETKWTFCEETQCFTITTLQTIGRGAQVYDSYGQKCNHRFLLNYGFCVERNVEIDGFCPNEVPLELGLDLAECPSSHGRGGDHDGRECWEKKLAFWSRGDSGAHHHLNLFNELQGSGAIAGVGAGSSFQALAAAVAGASARGTSTSSTAAATTLLSSSTEIMHNLASMNDVSSTSISAQSEATAASSQFIMPRTAVCPIKRVRVCTSNNENTRILFSMLRVLACNSSELDRITLGGRLSGGNGGGTPSSAVAQRLFGLPSASLTSASSSANNASSSSSSLRTCRDIRYPINLRNEHRAVELLLEITTRALQKYPTSLAQDVADLSMDDHGGNGGDDCKYPKYSNLRNAKLQVRGEKEVLHHFALWARTAMHVIEIILHELEAEKELVGSFGSSDGMAPKSSQSHVRNKKELGYDYVIQAMEEDDDCHSTILRYCSDVLGAVRRDELNRIAASVALGGRGSNA